MPVVAGGSGVRRLVVTLRDAVSRVLDTVPAVRRAVDDLVRVEVVDRAMVIAAQGLMTLLPLVVVLAAFLPEELTDLVVDRLRTVTGVERAAAELVTDQLADTATAVDADQVRTQTGLVGLLVTLLSASSFARAIQRMYERVFALPHIGGLRGRRRCLWWLLGWLLALELLAGVGQVAAAVQDALGVVAVPFRVVLQVALAAAVWGWSMHVLLMGRVTWRTVLGPALLTGIATQVYVAGSAVVMGPYAATSAQQFGTFGLVLAGPPGGGGRGGGGGAAGAGAGGGADPPVRRLAVATWRRVAPGHASDPAVPRDLDAQPPDHEDVEGHDRQ